MKIAHLLISLRLIHGQAGGVSSELRRVARSERGGSNIEAIETDAGEVPEVLISSSGQVQMNKPRDGKSKGSEKRLTNCDVSDHAYGRWAALSDEHMHRAEVNSAGSFRFRRLLEKLQRNQDTISVAVIGGSVEHCHTCPAFTHTWHQYVGKWLKKTFELKRLPSTKIVDLQLPPGGVIPLRAPFDFANKTQAKDLLGYDLVLIAGLTNYPLSVPKANNISYVKGAEINRQYAEALLRQLLSAPRSPAVLIVAWLNDHWWDTSNQHDMSMHTGMPYRWGTWEDEVYKFLSMYYEVSMVSARNALFHSLALSTAHPDLEPRFSFSELLADRLHPTPMGHNVFGQIVSNFICKHLMFVQDHPPVVTHYSVDVRHLPPPIFSNASRPVLLRRASDFSGFPEDMQASLLLSANSGESHDNDSMDANPEDVRSMTEQEIRPFLHLGQHWNATNGTTSVDPDELFKQELRAAILPLVLLEAMCWSRQGATRSMAANIQEQSLTSQGVALRPLALEPFRFLAISHIVLFHDDMNQHGYTFARFGQYWVQFFFALSGYVLYLGQRGAPHVPDKVDFIKKRVVRVYPMFFVGAMVGLSAAEEPLAAALRYAAGNGAILPGFLLIDSWVLPYGWQSPDAPAWFLCTLFCFWLCFPHWYSFVHGLRHGWAAVLMGYLASFGIPLAYKVSTMEAGVPYVVPAQSYFASFHPLCNWPSFVFGMGIARLSTEAELDNIPKHIRHSAASVALATILGIFSFLPWPMPGMPGGSLEILMYKGPVLLPLYGVLLFFVPAGQDLLLRPSVLESPILLWLGSASGSLFVLHWPIRNWMYKNVVNPNRWLVLAVQYVASFTYQHMEDNLRGKRLGNGKGFATSVHQLRPSEHVASDREAVS